MKATEIYKKHNGENSVTSLWRNSLLIIMRLTYEDKASIKLNRQQKNINPVDYAVRGALQQDVYRVLIVGLEDLKDRVRTCWASLDQQLINKAIDPWWPRLKPVVKVHGSHIEVEQLFTWLSCCCMKISLFYLGIHASTHFQLCFTIVI